MRSDGTVMGFNPMLRNGMAMKQQNTLARAAMGAAMASNQNKYATRHGLPSPLPSPQS